MVGLSPFVGYDVALLMTEQPTNFQALGKERELAPQKRQFCSGFLVSGFSSVNFWKKSRKDALNYLKDDPGAVVVAAGMQEVNNETVNPRGELISLAFSFDFSPVFLGKKSY